MRVADIDNANTSLQAKNATSGNSSGFLVKNDDHYENNYDDGTLESTHGCGNWIAKYAGDIGNSLKVSICPSANAFSKTLTGTVAVTANSKVVTGTATAFDTEVVAGSQLVINGETHHVNVVTNSTSLTLKTRHDDGATGNTVTCRWEYWINVDGAPGTSDYVSTRNGSGDEMHVAVVDEDGAFTGVRGEVLEIYPKLSKAQDAELASGEGNYYKNVINRKSKYIRWASHDSTLTNAGSLAKDKNFGTPTLPVTDSLVGGNDGVTAGNDEKIRGYNFFRSAEDVDVSLILGSDANQTIAVHLINNIAESRKDCMAILSVEQADVVDNAGNEAEDCVEFRNTLPSTSYACLDSGWKRQYDRYNDVYRYIPCNGDVGGLMVRTDETRDPWWSPAGYNRGRIKNVIKMAYNPRKADRDLLYKNGINPVISEPGEGTLLFGDKTLLSKPSSFDRINVRRLFIVLEKAIAIAAKYFLFEFNDAITRARFRNMVEPFLRDVQGRRGLTRYNVICDETNNTAEVINRNEFVGDIYVVPNYSINFITLRFAAVRNGVTFEEAERQLNANA